MTDIRHIAGSENVVADTLSRVEGIQKAIQHEELAKAQETDKEFKNIMADPQSLKMENTNPRDGNIPVQIQLPRPFITQEFRWQA